MTVLKRPSWLADRLVIVVESYPNDKIFHILDHGEYYASSDDDSPFGFEEDDQPIPGEWVVEYLIQTHKLEEYDARFLLGYAINFGCVAWNIKTGEKVAERWDVSELVPEKVWKHLNWCWKLDEPTKIEVL